MSSFVHVFSIGREVTLSATAVAAVAWLSIEIRVEALVSSMSDDVQHIASCAGNVLPEEMFFSLQISVEISGPSGTVSITVSRAWQVVWQ